MLALAVSNYQPWRTWSSSGQSLSSNQVYCACEGCGCTASTTDGALSFDLHLDESGDLEGSVTNQDTNETFAVYLNPQ